MGHLWLSQLGNTPGIEQVGPRMLRSPHRAQDRAPQRVAQPDVSSAKTGTLI